MCLGMEPAEGKRRGRRGQGHMGPCEEHAGNIQRGGCEGLPPLKNGKGAFPPWRGSGKAVSPAEFLLPRGRPCKVLLKGL